MIGTSTLAGGPDAVGCIPEYITRFETRYRAALAAREEPIPKEKDWRGRERDYECWVPCAPSVTHFNDRVHVTLT